MPLSWTEVSQKPEYLALPEEEKEIARRQYFDDVIAPQVPAQDRELALQQFLEDTQPDSLSTPPQPEVSPPPPAPTFTERLAEEAPKAIRPILEAGGSILGGIIGAGGGIPGAVAGGALGFAGGAELADIAETALGVRKPQTLEQELLETGGRLKTGLEMELGGQVGGRIFTKLGAKLLARKGAQLAKQQALIRKQRLAAAKKLGVPVTPGEATGRPFFSKLEGFFRKFITSAGTFKDFDLKRLEGMIKAREHLIDLVSEGKGSPKSVELLGKRIQKQIDVLLRHKTNLKGADLNALRDSVLKMFGSADSYESLGLTIKELIGERSKELNRVASELYERVTPLLAEGDETLIATPNLAKTVQDIIADEKVSLPAFRSTRLSRALNELQTAEKQGNINWKMVKRLRSDLNNLIAGADEAYRLAPSGQPTVKMLSSKEGGAYKRLKKALDLDIEQFSRNVGGEAKEIFDLANTIFRQGKLFVKNPSIKKILKSNPEQIYNIVVRPGQVSTIKLIKKELGETGIEPLKRRAIANLLGTDAPGEVFSGDKVFDRINRLGEDTLEALIGKKDLSLIKDIAYRAQAKESLPIANKFFQQLLKTSPEKVTSVVFRPGNTSNIRRIKSVLGENSSAWRGLKTALLEDMIELDANRLFNPDKFVRKLAKLGDDVLKTTFTPTELKAFNDLAEVSRLVDVSSATKDTLMDAITVGSGLATGGVLEGEGAVSRLAAVTNIVGLPKLLANLYLSPPLRKLFKLSFTTPAVSEQGAKLAEQLLNAIIKTGLIVGRKEPGMVSRPKPQQELETTPIAP
jgi:hypothetical protein